MAWVEQSGDKSWRVRYRRHDGTIGSIPGFSTDTDAEHHASDMESDQCRGTWIDTAGGHTTVAEFVPDRLDALDVDLAPRTTIAADHAEDLAVEMG